MMLFKQQVWDGNRSGLFDLSQPNTVRSLPQSVHFTEERWFFGLLVCQTPAAKPALLFLSGRFRWQSNAIGPSA